MWYCQETFKLKKYLCTEDRMLLAQKLDLTDEQIKVSRSSVELTAISRPWLCSGIFLYWWPSMDWLMDYTYYIESTSD